MITKFTDVIVAEKESLVSAFRKNFPGDYSEVVKCVFATIHKALKTGDYYEDSCLPNPEFITEIDHCSYSGIKLFIIASGYGDRFWRVFVDYGSCEACDVMYSLMDDFRQAKQNKNYPEMNKAAEGCYTLSLHIAQAIKELKNDYGYDD